MNGYSYDVFINGCGTVGRPLARKLYDLGFRKVLVSVKSAGKMEHEVLEKQRFASMVKETGFDVLIAKGGSPLEEFHKYGIYPLGYVEDYIFENGIKIGVIIDGTPNEKSALIQKETIYDKLNGSDRKTPVIFSGGSPKDIAPNYLAAPNCSGDVDRDHLLSLPYVRNVSCNATYLATMLSLVGKKVDWGDIEFINAFLQRRIADPHETHKPLGRGVTAEISDPKEEGIITKYVRDVKSVYPAMKDVPFYVLPTKNPWRHFHYAQTLITFKTPVTRTDTEEIREEFRKYPLAISYEQKKLSMNRVINAITVLGIPDAKITSPIYRVTWLNRRQIFIDGLTPQQLIDGPSKSIYVVEQLKKFASFQSAFNHVVAGITEGGRPIREFNELLTELINED